MKQENTLQQKHTIRFSSLFIVISFLSFTLLLPQQAAIGEKEIDASQLAAGTMVDLDVKDADIRDVARAFSAVSGKNIQQLKDKLWQLLNKSHD